MAQAFRLPPSSWLGAALLASLAAVPRVIRPDLVEYKFDEAMVVLNARAIVQDHLLPRHGQASSVPGLWHSPLLYYLVAPFLAVSPDPRLIVIGIGLANALAVGLAAVVFGRAFRPRVGLLTALLFASGSWAIVFSRKIWSIDLLPPLSVVALWGLLRAVDPRTKTPGLGRAWLALAVMAALNDSAWPLAVVVVLVHLLAPATRRGPALRWSLLGAAVFVAPLLIVVPRLIRLIARGPRLVDHVLSGGALDLSRLGYLVQLGDDSAFQVLAGPSNDFATETALAAALIPLLRALVITGALVAAIRAAKRWRSIEPRRPSPELIVLLWWLVPGLTALQPIVTVYLHHLVETMPTQFIFIALAIDQAATLAQAGLRRVRVSTPAVAWLPRGFCLAFAGFLALVQLGSFARYLPYLDEHAAATFFGMPLGQHLQAIETAHVRANDQPLIVFSRDGDTVGVDEDPTILASLVPTGALEIVDVDQGLLFPDQNQASALVVPDAVSRLNAVLAPWRAPAGPVGDATLLPGGYQQLEVRAPGAWLPADWRRLEVVLEDQAMVVGYEAPRQIQPGQPVEVEVAWRIGQPPAEPQRQSVFAHVIDDRGHSYAGHDFAPMPSSPWRKGATVVNRFSLTPPPDLPPGRYWVDFGRYQRPQVQPVRVVASGTPGPASVRLGPLAVPPRPPGPEISGLAATSVDFNGEIRLAGWKADQQGQQLVVVLAWQALKTPYDSYTVFVHLLGPTGSIVSQHDSEPRLGQFPTSTWNRGQRVIDPHPVPLTNLPAGSYRLEVGLYTAGNGRRLRTAHGDSVTLGAVAITAPPSTPVVPSTRPAPSPARPSPTPPAAPRRTPTPTVGHPSVTPTPTSHLPSPTATPTPRLLGS